MNGEDETLSPLPEHLVESVLNLWAYLARNDSDGRFREKEFSQLNKLGMHAAVMRATVEWLTRNKWLRRRQTDVDDYDYEFTEAGAEKAKELAQAEDLPIASGAAARAHAANAAKELAEVIGTSNQLAADHPERVPMYRASIEAGAGLLRDHAVTPAIVRSTLIQPANWIFQQAATAAVRDAADHAIRLLTGLL